jgi:hypothetical protein
MKAPTVFDPTPAPMPLARRRLQEEYLVEKSWRKVADNHRVNFYYVYRYVVYGRIPLNATIRRRLGIKRTVTINQLLRLRIQDMPPEILKLAIENREVICENR